MEEVLVEETRRKMTKVLEFLKEDLATVRVGRATPSLVENISVSVYGTKMRIVELATILVSTPNQIVLKPFDPANLEEIRKAIFQADLGLNPVVDGEVIRINIPPLTRERREAMVKVVGQKIEGARIMIRQIRGEVIRQIARKFVAKEISEDEQFRLKDKIQEVVREFNQKIEEMGEGKKREILGE